MNKNIRRALLGAAIVGIVFLPVIGEAALPKAPTGLQGVNDNNYINMFWGLIKTMGGYLAYLACGAAGIVFAGGAWRSFGDARRNGEWGGFLTTVSMGGGLLVATLAILNMVTGVFA